MELAFFTLLLKDGAYSVCGGVAVDHKWVFEVWLAKDWGRANCIDEGVECGFVFILPVELTTLGTKHNERVERGSEEAKISNVQCPKKLFKCFGGFHCFTHISGTRKV